MGWAEQGTVSLCVTWDAGTAVLWKKKTERPRDRLRKDKGKKTEKHKLGETDREIENH